jgi:hypothetical protein
MTETNWARMIDVAGLLINLLRETARLHECSGIFRETDRVVLLLLAGQCQVGHLKHECRHPVLAAFRVHLASTDEGRFALG